MSGNESVITPSSATRRLQRLSSAGTSANASGSASANANANANASGKKIMISRSPSMMGSLTKTSKKMSNSNAAAATSNGAHKTPLSNLSRKAASPSPLREDRLYAENDLLGELVLRLREERDTERRSRIEAEQRAIELEEKMEQSMNANKHALAAKNNEMEAEVREELEDLALDLQDQLREYKQKASKIDDIKRELEAERQQRMMMEEVVAASPEGGYIAILKERCDEMENMMKKAEQKALNLEEETKAARRDMAVLRDEAAKREALLEQEIDISRAAEEEEILRLRTRVRNLEAIGPDNTTDNRDNTNGIDLSIHRTSGPEALSEMDKPQASTEMHLHALALIRDRSRLLRRLHRAETDVMLLRAQCHKLESSLLSGGDVVRANALIKSAQVMANELGLSIPASLNTSNVSSDSIDTILKHVRPLFLSESTSDIELLPRDALNGYTSCLEDALVQSRADCVTLKEQSNESNAREMAMAEMLKEATERESSGAEVRVISLHFMRISKVNLIFTHFLDHCK